MNNLLDNGYTLLSEAIRKPCIDLLEIEMLLQKGADPNGKTNSGLPQFTPFTAIDLTHRSEINNVKAIVRMLLLYGGDINSEDINGRTILTNACHCYNKDNDLVLYLLKRGANPNGTLFHNPYYILTDTMGINKNSPIISSLIFYGAISSHFYTLTNPAINGLKHVKIKMKKMTSDYCVYYKCTDVKSIKKLIDSKEHYNEELFISLRKLKQPLGESINESTLQGNDLYSFTKEELIKYSPTLNVTFYFHKSEIPILLHSKKNPYTQTELPISFREQLVDIDYIPERTLEEMLANEVSANGNEANENDENKVNDKKEVIDDKKNDEKEIINETELDKQLFKYINYYNIYIQPECIYNFNVYDLIELQNVIHDANMNEVYKNIPLSFRSITYMETPEIARKRILTFTVKYLINYIRKYNLTSKITYAIDQMDRDNKTVKGIYNLFDVPMRKYVQYDIKYIKLSQFTSQVNKYINPDSRNVSSFINSLDADQKSILQFLDNITYIEMYSKFIIISVTELLRERSNSDNLENTWEDLKLTFLRYKV